MGNRNSEEVPATPSPMLNKEVPATPSPMLSEEVPATPSPMLSNTLQTKSKMTPSDIFDDDDEDDIFSSPKKTKPTPVTVKADIKPKETIIDDDLFSSSTSSQKKSKQSTLFNANEDLFSNSNSDDIFSNTDKNKPGNTSHIAPLSSSVDDIFSSRDKISSDLKIDHNDLNNQVKVIDSKNLISTAKLPSTLLPRAVPVDDLFQTDNKEPNNKIPANTTSNKSKDKIVSIQDNGVPPKKKPALDEDDIFQDSTDIFATDSSKKNSSTDSSKKNSTANKDVGITNKPPSVCAYSTYVFHLFVECVYV